MSENADTHLLKPSLLTEPHPCPHPGLPIWPLILSSAVSVSTTDLVLRELYFWMCLTYLFG